MTVYVCENWDNDPLNVAVAIPQSPLATVIIHHGYAGSMKSPVVRRIADVFNRHGMIAVTPDTRHSLNSSGGDIAQFTFGEHAANLADIVAWTRAQNWFTGPLHLAGYSLGGFSALSVAAELKNPASLLLVAPIFSGRFLAQALETSSPGIMNHWQEQGSLEFTTDLGRSFNAPFSCWGEWLKADSLLNAKSIAAPVTMITASGDSQILPHHIDAALAALSTNFARAVRIRGEDHAFSLKGQALEKAIEHQIKLCK